MLEVGHLVRYRGREGLLVVTPVAAPHSAVYRATLVVGGGRAREDGVWPGRALRTHLTRLAREKPQEVSPPHTHTYILCMDTLATLYYSELHNSCLYRAGRKGVCGL